MWATFLSFCKLSWAIFVRNRWRTFNLLLKLDARLSLDGYTISPQNRKRIYFYTAQSAITTYWFSMLRGYKPTRDETQTALLLGAFTPIADDLMDSTGQSFQALEIDEKLLSAESAMFHFFLNELKAQKKTNKWFATYFDLAHNAQDESLKQLQNEPLDLNLLETITYNKGGYYTTLYRFALNHPPVKGEEEAIYTLGAILQVLNDLFDMHKDYHNGVQTLVTRTADIHFIAEKLKVLEARFRQQFMALDYPSTNKKKAFRAIMAIVTRGHVALAQFQKLQGDKPTLDIGSYARKPLIVDMEKPVNIWRNMKATKEVL